MQLLVSARGVRFAALIRFGIVLASCVVPVSISKASGAIAAQPYASAAVSSVGMPTNAALFISPFGGDRKVYIFDAAYKQIGLIRLPGKGTPSLLSTDVSGDLYVATQDTREVRIYRPPSYDRYTALHLPKGDLIFGLSVDQISGVIAVLECQCGGGGQASAIYFFRRGETVPCNVFTNFPGLVAPSVFDKEGTLFFQAYNGSGNNLTVDSVSGECSATSYTQYSFKTPIYAYGIYSVTKDDNIVFQSFGSPFGLENAKSLWPIYTYAHPVNGVFGDPIATTILDNYDGGPDGEEVFNAIASDGNHVWGSIYNGKGGGNRLFAYPQGGRSLHTINVLPGTVAVYPPVVP